MSPIKENGMIRHFHFLLPKKTIYKKNRNNKIHLKAYLFPTFKIRQKKAELQVKVTQRHSHFS